MDLSSPRLFPRAPFAGWPIGTRIGANVGVAWFVPDAALCVQSEADRIDLPAARAYVQTIRSIRDAEQRAIERAGGLRIYQDLRSFRGVTRDARSYLVDAAREDFGRWNVVSNTIELAAQTPLVHMTIRLVSRAASQIGLRAFQLSTDLAGDLERDGVRATATGLAHT